MIPGRGAKGETAGWAGNAKFAAGQGTQSEPYWPDLEGARCAHSGSQEGLIVKRSRRGGRRPQHGGNGGGGGGGGSSNSGGGFNPNRTYDSSGPEVKIRGSASHVYEKYLQLARDANSGGDRVMAENYLQHAEHYYRIMAAAAAQQAQYAAQQAAQNPQSQQHGQQPQGQSQPSQGAAPAFSPGESQSEEEEGEEAEAS